MDSAEISVIDILKKAWRLRGLWTSVLFLCLLLACAWIFKTTISIQTPVSYFVTLKNIENSRFPNGTAFSPQDLLIPPIIEALENQFDIREDIDLRRHINVQYGSPMAAAVSMKYREKLSTRSLGQAEIDAINSAYELELQGLMLSGLRIDVNYVGLGVDKDTGSAIATALPQIWSDIYSSEFRIFADTRLQGVAVTQSDEGLDTPSSILVANARLTNIEKGLVILSNDNRLASLVTAANYSAEDVRAELKRFRTIYFNPIFADGLDGNDTVSATYLRERYLAIDDRKRRVAGLDQTLSDLRQYQHGSKDTRQQDLGTVGQGGNRSESLQVGDNALGQIMELTRTASLSDYVRSVLEQRQEVIAEISSLQKEIELASGPNQTRVTPQFRELAAAELAQLTANYQELLKAARQMTREKAGDLYQPLTPPEVIGSFVPARALLAFPAFLLFGFALSAAIVLCWPERRRPTLTSVVGPEMKVSHL